MPGDSLVHGRAGPIVDIVGATYRVSLELYPNGDLDEDPTKMHFMEGHLTLAEKRRPAKPTPVNPSSIRLLNARTRLQQAKEGGRAASKVPTPPCVPPPSLPRPN